MDLINLLAHLNPRERAMLEDAEARWNAAHGARLAARDALELAQRALSQSQLAEIRAEQQYHRVRAAITRRATERIGGAS